MSVLPKRVQSDRFRNSIKASRVSLFLLVGTVWSSATAAIDFTPISGERTVDGIVFKHVVFRENGAPISYDVPRGWTCTGNSTGLRLTPPDATQAYAEIVQQPLPEPQPLDEAAVEKLRAQASASVPPGSLDLTLVGEEAGNIRIKGAETYGMTQGYVLHGEEYQCNVLYANLNDTQLRFRVVARKKDFEAVFRAFRGSLFTLRWL